MTHDTAYLVRPVRAADIDDFLALRDLAGPGFTSLMVADDVLEARLAAAAAAFSTPRHAPAPERYWLALEHRASGRVVGSAAVKGSIGDHPPFFNFRMLQIAQASAAAGRRFDLDVLILVNEFTACTEVGSLFVRPEHRAGGVGRLLAQARYLLIAAEPQRFSPIVVSELRGVVDEQGKSPFWDALGRHFFRMEFEEADRLSATTDNQFILDLMPKYPIYVDLLPAAARAVLGQCHPHGRGALRLLEWEGFRYDRVLDIFDAGPLVSCPRDSIRTFREARRHPVRIGAVNASPPEALLATGRAENFRMLRAAAQPSADHVTIGDDAADALGVRPDEHILMWSGDTTP